jgi:hypothetical protein
LSAQIGHDLITDTSKGLAEFDGHPFDAAVTMGYGAECPLVLAKRRVEYRFPIPTRCR